MKKSLLEFLETLEESQELDNTTLGIIRIGMNIDPEFWDNFIRICNNPGFADLLRVNKVIVARWPSLIRGALEQIHKLDSELAVGKKATMIPTGK